jgi:hypothetical protein
MNAHSPSQSTQFEQEPMIDARQASYALRLPYYWFANPKMRTAKRIPHYLLSRLVRFRLSELEAWNRQHAARPGSDPEPVTGGDDE